MATEMKVTISAEDKASATIDNVKRKIGEIGGDSSKIDDLSARITGLAAKFGPIIAAAGAAAFAVKQFVQPFIDAAAESETAQARIIAALRSTGQYSAEAVKGIDTWSAALIRSAGVSDELAKSLVAQGASMGLNVEQSKRLVETSADVAAALGIDITSAMQKLTLASDGDSRSMAMLARQFNLTVEEGTPFEELLGQIQERTSGAAAAQMTTYAGQVKRLSEEYGEFKESIGQPLMAPLTALLSTINQAINSHRILTEEVGNLTDAELNRRMALLQLEKAQAGTLGHFDTDIKAVDAKIEALQNHINALRRARREARLAGEDAEKAGRFASPAAKPDKDALAKALKAQEEIAERLAESRDYLNTLELKAYRDAEAEKARLDELAAQNKDQVNNAMLASFRKAKAAEVAAEKKAVADIRDELKKWGDEYEKLVKQHEQALEKIERTQKEHSERMVEMREAEASVDASLRKVQAAGASPGERKVLARLELKELEDKAKATADLAERVRLLAEVAERAANTDFSLDRFERREGLNSKIPGVADFAKELELTKVKDAAGVAEDFIYGIKAQMTDAIAELAAQDARLLETQVNTATAIGVKMEEAAAEVHSLIQAADALGDELARKHKITIDTKHAQKDIADLNKLMRDLYSEMIVHTSTASVALGWYTVQHPFMDQGVKHHDGYWPTGAPTGEHVALLRNDEVVTPPEKFREHGARMLGGGGGATLNITVNSSGSAKDLDKQLADLWRSNRSELKRAVA